MSEQVYKSTRPESISLASGSSALNESNVEKWLLRDHFPCFAHISSMINALLHFNERKLQSHDARAFQSA